MKRSKKLVNTMAILQSSNPHVRKPTNCTVREKSPQNATAASIQMLLTITWHRFKGVLMDTHDTIKQTSATPAKSKKIDTMRMKDIIAQLSDVIYLLCSAKSANITTIFDQFTNITREEREALNIIFPNDEEDASD